MLATARLMATSPPPAAVAAAATSTASTTPRRILEGVFAVAKPQWASSAGVLRDLQHHFATSPLFAPWLESQRRQMLTSGARQKAIDQLKVKLGHGGTLDPLATGVLIVGVGRGTKALGGFLECTKTYETVVLFGAATDSYDAVGKVVGTASTEHITKELVEEKLAEFRGKIMQKPSVFSALKVDGKKMYEYAREGKAVPNVAARPVEVKELELLEWLPAGSHDFAWPKEELDEQSRNGAQTLLGIRPQDAAAAKSRKRSRSPSSAGAAAAEEPPSTKPRIETVSPPKTGMLPLQDVPEAIGPVEEEQAATIDQAAALDALATSAAPPEPVADPETITTAHKIAPPAVSPPAVRLRMTVTSGFYVRSLCHDLGVACGSLGLMAELIRQRQGDYTLGENVVGFDAFEKGTENWEPLVKEQLEKYMQRESWAVEELENDEEWEERKKEIKAQGGHRGGRGKWRGRRY